MARAENDKACLRHCMRYAGLTIVTEISFSDSLLHRLVTESTSFAFTASETPRIHQAPIPSTRLPPAATPMDELWSLKAALDLVRANMIQV